MRLQSIETVNSISGDDFRENFFQTRTPLIIRDLAKSWPAYEKWNWDYFHQLLGKQLVGIYNNVKSAPHIPVNKADAHISFGQYIDRIRKGPAEWRIFLYNIFSHAPELTNDFVWPDHLMRGFVKRVPMLFMGGEGSVTHMHFDMDLSHILHTQFVGRKRVLLFPYEEQYKLYRKPFEVMSFPDFSYYYDKNKSKLNLEKFPALNEAKGYEVILEHGDTLFMPCGYWHHIEYVESGFAMSLRALQNTMTGKLHGAWNLVGMRSIDTLMKKTVPQYWHSWKEKQAHAHASKYLNAKTKDDDLEGFSSAFDLLWKKEQ